MPDRHDVLDASGTVAAVVDVYETGWVTFIVEGADPQQFPTVAEFLAVLHVVGGSCPTLEDA